MITSHTTDLVSYLPRIAALRDRTQRAVCVSMEMWLHAASHPETRWTVTTFSEDARCHLHTNPDLDIALGVAEAFHGILIGEIGAVVTPA